MSVKLMKCALTLACLSAFVLPVDGGERETPTETRIAVKVLQEPLTVKAPRDPDILLESKFVAVVQGKGVFFDRNSFNLVVVVDPSVDLPPYLHLRKFLVENYGRRILHYVNGRRFDQPPRLDRSAAGSPGMGAPSRMGPPPGMGAPPGMGMPPGRGAPPLVGLPYLRSRRRVGMPIKAVPKSIHKFLILAPNPERAEELARALVAAYNSQAQRLSDIGQAELEEIEKRLAKLTEEITKTQEIYENVSQQLQKLEPMPKRVYEELKTKDWMLRVDIAGVKGKLVLVVKLLEGLRNKTRPSEQTLLKIEEIRTVAEVELAGLLEQRRKTEELLKMYNQQEALQTQQARAKDVLTGAKKNKLEAQSRMERLKKSLTDELVEFELAGPIEVRPANFRQ